MKAADVMVNDVITLRPDDTVQKAAKVLLDHRISGARSSMLRGASSEC